MAHEYLSPDEIAEAEIERAAVRELLRQISDDGVNAVLAIELGEPADVVALWVDRMWDGLRYRLNEHQRLLALTMFLEPAMHSSARRIVSALAGPHPGGVS